MIQQPTVVKTSFYIFIIIIAMAWGLHLMTPFLTVLFSFLLLDFLTWRLPRWAAIVVFLLTVAAFLSASVHFSRQLVQELPSIADRTIPTLAAYSREYQFELPFSDWTSLLENLKNQAKATSIALAAQLAIKEVVYIILGFVVAITLFINSKLDLDEGNYAISNNFYSELCRELSRRFSTFYQSFKTVMGAQIIISSINTLFTGLFVLIIGLPFAKTVIVITFLTGLLPIVGNLMSNSIIFSIGLTVSPEMAIGALIFLIVLHKFEYFLNSKIIGGRIKNPMWLTLIALIVGEAAAGIPGMILAPVFFRYAKLESSQFAVNKA